MKDQIQNPIISEVKKAIDLWLEGTYNESEFYSHILAIIRDNSGQNEAQYHKEQLQRLLFVVEDFRETHRLFTGGNRSLYGKLMKKGIDLDKKTSHMTTIMGYSTEKFKTKVNQNKMF